MYYHFTTAGLHQRTDRTVIQTVEMVITTQSNDHPRKISTTAKLRVQEVVTAANLHINNNIAADALVETRGLLRVPDLILLRTGVLKRTTLAHRGRTNRREDQPITVSI